MLVPRLVRSCSLLAVLAASNLAVAAAPTIAVMPLQNLSGGKNTIGAAFRETLTVDLGQTAGVKVVERAAIDKVLKEQAFDSSKTLEGVAGVRVGTLLGASHLVTGAYQRQGNALRVTARLISVESGVIVGATKVDGDVDRLLELQDKVSGALLASAGWKASSPVQPRKRPRIPAKSIERFGDAQLEPDPEKQKAILKEVVATAPQFDYAVTALAALESRMAGYEAVSSVKYSEREHALLAASTDNASDTTLRAKRIRELLPLMRNARRYHALLAACDALGNPPREEKEQVLYHRFLALEGLKRTDLALQTGEELIAKMPDSPHFADVETRMRTMAEVRRTVARRKAEYEADLAEKRKDLGGKRPTDPEKSKHWDWAPCIAARWNRQYNDLMVEGCRAFVKNWAASKETQAMEFVNNGRMFVILALGDMGKFTEMRRELAEFRKLYPLGDEEIDKKLAEWPTD